MACPPVGARGDETARIVAAILRISRFFMKAAFEELICDARAGMEERVTLSRMVSGCLKALVGDEILGGATIWRDSDYS